MTLVSRAEVTRMLKDKDEEKMKAVIQMMGGRRNFTGDQEAIEHMRATIRRLQAELVEARKGGKG